MKRIRTGISLALLATLSSVLTAPVTSNAEWVQNPIGVPRAPGCDPGYSWQKLGVRYQCATPQPTCAYGFASGPVWTGTAWSYSCNIPPPPACPSGTNQTAAPSWNGAAWVGQQCQPSAPTPKDPTAQCAARAKQDNVTMGPVTRQYKYNSAAGPATEYYHDGSQGPYWEAGAESGTTWVVMCTFVNATGDFVPDSMAYRLMEDIPYIQPN